MIWQVVIFKKIQFYPVTRFSPGKINLGNGYNVFDENERLGMFQSKNSFWEAGIFSKIRFYSETRFFTRKINFQNGYNRLNENKG